MNKIKLNNNASKIVRIIEKYADKEIFPNIPGINEHPELKEIFFAGVYYGAYKLQEVLLKNRAKKKLN
jgi:hypothetical protein